jgi:AbrB family looped-hinge helix DNA binding protein
MQSTITERGQTVVPAQIRKMFHLSPADRLEWLVDPSGIRVLPVRADPVKAFRGQGVGKSTQRLLAQRRIDAKAER